MNVNLSTIITPLRSLWDDLVERRLWPVAIALVIALIALPIWLSKPSEHAAPPSPAPAATGSGSPGVAFQAAVSTEGRKSSEIRKDLRNFKQKNPFTPQGLSAGTGAAGATGAAGTATVSTTGSTASTGPVSGGGSSSSGATQGSGSSGSAPTAPSPATTTKTFYYHYTVNVRFGKTGKEDNKTLTEFRALPGSDNPVLVFMGVKGDGKTAVFLMSAKATTVGDGKCSPSDTECTFLYLKKGDKQTIEAVDTSGAVTDYTLVLRSVDVKRTTAPKKAKASKKAKGSKRERAAARRKSRARHRMVVKTFRTLGL